MQKKCYKCKKLLSKENFYKCKSNKDGLQAKCKKCIKKYEKENNVRIKEYQKKWRDEHKEKIKEYNAYYRIENKEELKEQKKIYYQNTLEIRKQHFRKYYKENREEFLLRAKKYYALNREKVKKYVKKWEKNNPEKIKAYRKKAMQKESHKNYKRNYFQKRKAKIKKLDYSLTIEQWEEIKKYFNDKCCYCGKEKKLTQEHFIPVTKGGEYTHNNIIPACQSCNSSKGNKDFFIWYITYKHYSKKREQKILSFLEYGHNKIQQLTLL